MEGWVGGRVPSGVQQPGSSLDLIVKFHELQASNHVAFLVASPLQRLPRHPTLACVINIKSGVI